MIVWFLIIPFTSCLALNNGLALKPPMGWMQWQRYRCLVDCELYPNECISEVLFKKVADIMVSDGYLSAGYEYVAVDDCWMSFERDPVTRKLQANSTRFPSGMKALADYIHAKGLKMGIYADFGSKTCSGYPGSLGFLDIDAQTFAEWGVDYLKLDGCFVDTHLMETGYANMSKYLNQSGRSIVFSCSWPYYMEQANIKPNYTALTQYCNLWRNWNDISDSWSSVSSIMEWFSENQNRIAPFAGPGHWNDPDMDDNIAIWRRTITPKINGHFSYAIAFVNHRNDGYPYRLAVKLHTLGLNNKKGYVLQDVFENVKLPVTKPHDEVVLRVNPSESDLVDEDDLSLAGDDSEYVNSI